MYHKTDIIFCDIPNVEGQHQHFGLLAKVDPLMVQQYAVLGIARIFDKNKWIKRYPADFCIFEQTRCGDDHFTKIKIPGKKF